MKQLFRLLAIETSCDETAAAIIEFDDKLNAITPLSSVVASQIPLHKKYGGVYPELASRAHSQKILPVVAEALQQAGITNYPPRPTSRVETGELRIKDCHCEESRLMSRTTKQSGPLLSSRPTERSKDVEGSLESDVLPRDDTNDTPRNDICNSIDALAVTTGPGLAGSLIVGVEFARGLAAATGIPVVPVNHLEGHVYANFVSEISNSKFLISKANQTQSPTTDDPFRIGSRAEADDRRRPTDVFPALALVVSGGHTMLVLMRGHLNYEIIGSTLDDAAGECFDKVARMLGLPYPGGPALEKLALGGNPKAYDFPRSMLHSHDHNYSFSGLKTAVFYKLRELGLVNDHAEPIPTPTPRRWPNGLLRGVKRLPMSLRADIAASFQQTVIDVLVAKTLRAAEELKVKSILVGGGVIVNSALRSALISSSCHPRVPTNVEDEGSPSNSSVDSRHIRVNSGDHCKVYLSPSQLATDNALSIAVAGAHHFARGHTIPWQKLDANPSLKLS